MSALRRTLLLALLCTACSGGKPAHGVTHLDPRLLSGDSSADVLAAMGIEWSQVTDLDDPAAALGPWELRLAERLPTESGRGVFLRGNVVRERPPPGAREGRVERVLLAATEAIDAAELNVFEVDVASNHNGVAKLSWTNEQGTGEHSISVRFDASSTAAPVRLSPAGHPEWVGRISDLRIAPMEEGRQRFELHAVRSGWVAFTPGADPLEGDHGDGGLIALGFEARRVWPTDFAVPLYDRCVVPARGRLVVEVALAGTSRQLTGTVHFLVDVKTPKGDWKNVLERSFVPGDMTSRWRVLVCDLARYGGRTLDLRLRTVLGKIAPEMDAGTSGRLERARVYWGNPIVLGALAEDRRPNIVLVTLDTTRADTVGALTRGQESRAPFLNRIGREGLTFTNAWTTCNSTSPAHVSIMTGLALQDHGVLNNRMVLSAQATTLAERLRAEGYHTAAAVSASHLQAGYSGLGQGVDQFLMADPAAALDGGITIDAVETWLHQWRESGERPVFLWVHLFDAHTPYGPPEEFMSAYLRRYRRQLPSRYSHPPSLPNTRWSSPGEFLEDVTNRKYADFMYRSGVAYADQLTDRLWASIEATTGRDSSALIVTADHGESLGERGLWYVHRGLFTEVMQVPLIMRLPQPVARRVPSLVSVLDIPSTILSYLGLPAHEGLRGRDLFEAVGGADWSDRRIWLEHSDLVQVACRDARFQFIQTLEPFDLRQNGEILPAGQTQLFRVAKNSDLDVDVGQELPARLAGYEKLLADWRATALGVDSTRRSTTPEEESQLNQLGYVDGD